MDVIDTDYLVVGAGAAGLAFTDALIAGCDAEVVMVDRRCAPGGHWNDAYPFVRIHHASAVYGVNSLSLGTDTIDRHGPNAGFYERSTGVEVSAYFQRVMDEVLLPSGRVRFYALCDYAGNGAGEHAFVSRLTGRRTAVRVRRRVVDTTYLQVSVPATHRPAFEVDPRVRFMPVGELVNLAGRPTGYTILGGGKTAMDACNWLLDNGEDPDRIRWIVPRDSWVLDRGVLQPLDLVVGMVEGFSLGIEALAEAGSEADLWRRLEACGQLCRLDPRVTPTMNRGAILSAAEREALASIERVVRRGRVRALESDRVVLEEGVIPVQRGEVFVDCTAAGFRTAPERPIFSPGQIVVQSLIGAHTTYNAALVGYVESTARDDAEKNRLCTPVAQLDRPLDWVRMMRGVLETAALHGAEPDIAAWRDASRLNMTRGLEQHEGDPRLAAAFTRWQTNAEPALANAARLLS